MAGDYMQGDADNAIQVPFSDDESAAASNDNAADLLDDDKPASSPEEHISRKQKRQERIKRLLDEGKQSKEELGRLRSEQDGLKGELERLKGYVAANENARRPAPHDDGRDPYESRLDAVYERQSSAYQAAQAEIKSGTFDEARSKHYERIAREIESEKSAIHAERVLATREPARRAEQAQQVWVQKYPEVYGNPSAYQFAEATFRRRQALGEAATNQLVDEIMGETMAQFRLGPKRAPSASERSRLSGLPASGGGGSSGGGSSIAMTPALRRMAAAAYSELPEHEAVKKWADTTGKRLREKKVLG
jgi:hypothetical protein